jgi:hypothetical protein
MLSAALSLAGCADQKFYGLDMQIWADALKTATGLKEAPGITMEQAASIPYSSLGYRIGSSTEGLLVLAADNGDDLLWTSSDRRTLATRHGRIVKSANFGFNLTNTELLSPDPFEKTPLPTANTYRSQRLCDFTDIGLFGVRIHGEFVVRGYETIKILEHPLPTLALLEDCRSKEIDWRFQNVFWLDSETGFVWKSTQSIHPNLEPITVEILRPPA